MTAALVALALLAAPLLPLAAPHVIGLERVRDLWLRGVLAASVLVTPPWCWPILAWYSWRWPRAAEPWRWVPEVATWAGIALLWALLLRLPAWAWDWTAAGWVAIAGGYVAGIVWQGLRAGWRSFGTRAPARGLMGSPVMLAQFLALTLPFAPWWAWPVYAVGLWVTCSWGALLALVAGGIVWYAGPA